MENKIELAIIYENQRLIDYYPYTFSKTTSRTCMGINTIDDFYSALLGYYGIPNIAIVEGEKALKGNIAPLLQKENGEYFENILFIALGYIPTLEEIEDNYSCENKEGRLLTYINLSKVKKKPDTINDVFKLKYSNLAKPEGLLLSSINDIINYNSKAIEINGEYAIPEEDLRKTMYNIKCKGDIYNLYIHKESIISPEVIFNTTKGKIIIDENAEIKPFSYIEGPAYIGKNCIIDNARIYGGSSIIYNSYVSGIIDNSIIMPHTVVHPYVNLKRCAVGDMSEIEPMTSAITKATEENISIGAYTKILSGSIISPETVIGFGSELKPNNTNYPIEIPPFVSGVNGVLKEVTQDSLLERVSKHSEERNVELEENEINILKKLHEKSQSPRQDFLNSILNSNKEY
jgi:carbonic anhydrase/acetyltransferase-like protein (isoleucine patch superfamily)